MAEQPKKAPEQPLVKSIKIGKMIQVVEYEGINAMCFACGRIKHRKENCLALIKKSELPSNSQGSNKQQSNLKASGAISQEGEQRDVDESGKEEYGDWMVVKRKKRPNGGGKSP